MAKKVVDRFSCRSLQMRLNASMYLADHTTLISLTPYCRSFSLLSPDSYAWPFYPHGLVFGPFDQLDASACMGLAWSPLCAIHYSRLDSYRSNYDVYCGRDRCYGWCQPSW